MCDASRNRRLKCSPRRRRAMDNATEAPFLKFLEAGVSKGGFETDDVLAALLPLMKQVLAAHRAGQVAPLDGVGELTIADEGHLAFEAAGAGAPRRNMSRVEALQSPVSHALEVVGEARRTTDIDEASLAVSDLSVGTSGENITKPVYLPGYHSWEQAVGHHDELTD